MNLKLFLLLPLGLATSLHSASALHLALQHKDALVATASYGVYMAQLRSFQDAPQPITAWIHQIAQEQGIKEQLTIKIDAGSNPKAHFSAFGTRTIIISKERASELTAALQEANHPALAVYATFARHEMAHLIHHDSFWRLVVTVGVSLATTLGLNLIPTPSWLSKPTSYIGMGISMLYSWMLGMLKSTASNFVINTYTTYQERRADNHAFATAHNHQELELMVKYLESKQDQIIALLAGELEINPNLPPEVKAAFARIQQELKTQYQAEAPQELFKPWLKKQLPKLAQAEKTLFPERPLLAQTISDAKAVAAAA